MEHVARQDKKKRQAFWDERLADISAGITVAKEAIWLYEKFGDGVYADVLGLCKVATISEIEEKGWSLTPGAYVGVAPVEDDGVDFEERMAEIHRELLSLQAESNDLMDTISKNMPITSNQETRRFDISAIDFGLLRTEFAKVKRKNLVMRDLEEIIQQKLDRMLFTNPERINYYERYQQIIMGYNAEQDRATIEKTFMDLMDLANQMNQEEQRYAREGFSSDEELSLYDMLFRDDLSKNDIKKLKEVATTLLRKIKNRIAEIDHWTDKQETKAEIDNLIRNILYDELPLCYDEISISTYRQRIYEYVYTRYKSVA